VNHRVDKESCTSPLHLFPKKNDMHALSMHALTIPAMCTKEAAFGVHVVGQLGACREGRLGGKNMYVGCYFGGRKRLGDGGARA
jgi:hypothetical protein